MKQPFFAVPFATLLFALGAPSSAEAQMVTGQVYSGQQTANQNTGFGQAEYNRRELDRLYGDKRAPGESQADYGRRLMASGLTTTKFQTRAFPLDEYMKTVWNGDEKTRQKNLAEWRVQNDLWQQEAKARGARLDDMGDAYALAVVMAYEAYTGDPVGNPGFALQAKEFADFFASMSAYQGYSTLEKQHLYESAMLLASNALRMRRAKQISEARVNGESFLNSWANGKLPGALKTLAPYAAKP